MQSVPNPNQMRYVPHKVLKESALYLAVGDDSGIVLEIKTVVMKVNRVYSLDGKPASNPDGTPQYSWQTQIFLTALTKAEYDVRKKMDDFQ